MVRSSCSADFVLTKGVCSDGDCGKERDCTSPPWLDAPLRSAFSDPVRRAAEGPGDDRGERDREGSMGTGGGAGGKGREPRRWAGESCLPDSIE